MVTMTSNARGFKTGRSTYVCDCCGRRTRETTVRGSSDCAECFDLAGLQNMVWDDCFRSIDANERDALLQKIVSLGGDEQRVRSNYPDLFAA